MVVPKEVIMICLDNTKWIRQEDDRLPFQTNAFQKLYMAIMEYEHNTLSLHGVGKGITKGEVLRVLHHLVVQDILFKGVKKSDFYGTVSSILKVSKTVIHLNLCLILLIFLCCYELLIYYFATFIGNECGNKPQVNIKASSTSFSPVIEKAMTIVKKVKDSITCWSSLSMGRLQELSILNMAMVDVIVEARGGILAIDYLKLKSAATKIVSDSWANDKDVQKALHVRQEALRAL
nr:ATP-dependent DNA helicase Q-like 4A [Tanacetum cinerariifolium]